MKKFVAIVSGLAAALTTTSVGAQTAHAATGPEPAPGLPSAEDMVDPTIKKGSKIYVFVKDTTDKQTVPVYNNKGKKIAGHVMMGTHHIAQSVKKVNGKKIVKISANQWLNAKDITKE